MRVDVRREAGGIYLDRLGGVLPNGAQAVGEFPQKITIKVTFVVAYLPHLGYSRGAKSFHPPKGALTMTFSSISLRTIALGIVAIASASYAVASVHPLNPMPQVPTGKIVASAHPFNPMPQVPTGKIVASAHPLNPMPQVPTGKIVASAHPLNPMPQVPTGKIVASAHPLNPMPQVPTGKAVEPSIAG